MKFTDAYKQYVTEAKSCKMTRKKRRVVKECGAPMMMVGAPEQLSYGCQDEQNQMIVNNLMRIKDHAEFIAQYTQSSGKSEEWVQEKIAAVAREIDNIYHFVEGERNKMQPSGCDVTSVTPMQTNMIMGDKPGAAPVGTYVFSTEKKHNKIFKKKKAGKIYNM